MPKLYYFYIKKFYSRFFILARTSFEINTIFLIFRIEFEFILLTFVQKYILRRLLLFENQIVKALSHLASFLVKWLAQVISHTCSSDLTSRLDKFSWQNIRPEYLCKLLDHWSSYLLVTSREKTWSSHLLKSLDKSLK